MCVCMKIGQIARSSAIRLSAHGAWIRWHKKAEKISEYNVWRKKKKKKQKNNNKKKKKKKKKQKEQKELQVVWLERQNPVRKSPDTPPS